MPIPSHIEQLQTPALIIDSDCSTAISAPWPRTCRAASCAHM